VGGLNAEQLDQLALAEEAKPTELVWLKVQYPEQDEAVNVLALEQKPRVAKEHGAVLILHDKEQHADWPYFIRPLRMSLPDAGWDTLTVNLPYENAQKLPERSLTVKVSDQITLTDQITSALQKPAARSKQKEGAAEKNKEAVSDEVSDAEKAASNIDDASLDKEVDSQRDENVDIDLADKNKEVKTTLPYKERALLHVNAAIDYLQGKGYENIIIVGYRSGADLALDHIKPNVSQIPKQGFALVMVDPVLQTAYQTDMATFFGEKFKAPVLDIVNGVNLESRVLAREREVAARVSEMEQYQQISLMTRESGAFQQSLIRRVRYWLEKYAPGMAATKM
jgi:hypothetical protein